jgi:hypothetical protein
VDWSNHENCDNKRWILPKRLRGSWPLFGSCALFVSWFLKNKHEIPGMISLFTFHYLTPGAYYKIQWAYLDEHLPKHLRSRLKANELTWSDVRDWNPIAAIDQLGHPITTKLIPGGDPDNYVNEKTGDTWFVRYFFDTQTAQLVAAKY